MTPMELLRKALDAWGLELVLSQAYNRYTVERKDGGRKLRHCISVNAVQDMQAIHGEAAVAEVLKVVLMGVFDELLAEQVPA